MLLDQLVDVCFVEPPEAVAGKGRDKKAASALVMTAEEVERDVPGFFQAVKRAVLSNKVCA